MFDVGWSELVVIGVVALVVIGPKELPGVIRAVGRAVGKLRTMAGEFRTQFDDAMREAELHEVKKTFDEAASSATSAMTEATEPLTGIKDEFNASVEGLREDVSLTPAAGGKAGEIEADAKAMEAEIAAEPAPKPRRSRKKAAESAGDDA